MKLLVVEGWRMSCHSYALVNQHQLLHLLEDARFRIAHRDLPFFDARWAAVDCGLGADAKARLAAIASPPAESRADVTYRISYPFRLHAGAGRVFVFGTCEIDRTLPQHCVGADGRAESADPSAVDIVTPSSWSQRAFLAAGFSPNRVHVIPHGIDPALASPCPEEARTRMRQWLRLSEGQFGFLNVGAMTWNKGVGPLIAAFAVHRRSHPSSVLILKGGDALYGNHFQVSMDEAGRLRREARDPTLTDSIRYISQNLPCEILWCLYRSVDAYVSSYRAEGFNLPVLEAMAAELPVLVTRGGATDDFCDEQTSFKIEADRTRAQLGVYLEPRVESIADQMSRMVEDAAGRSSRARRAREYAVENLPWKRVAAQLAQLLDSEAS
jgi:glycosyltransferase involved in cell wall biosynthesis